MVAFLVACQTTNQGSSRNQSAAMNGPSDSPSQYGTEGLNPFPERINWSHGGSVRGPSEIDLRAILMPVSYAIGYPKFYSRSQDAVIRVYDEAGNAIETHEHAGDLKEW